jgi:SAM-dependent methyltransferase
VAKRHQGTCSAGHGRQPKPRGLSVSRGRFCSNVLKNGISCAFLDPSVSGIMDFDSFAETYEQEVATAIRFAGIPHRFFLEAKLDHLLATLRRRFENLPRLRVLDLGCGIGLIDEVLKVHLPKLVGVDVSEKVLQAARFRNPEIDYRHFSDDVLPFGDRSFDVVFAICVWHHVPPDRWKNFLSEIARVVAAKGLLLIYEHNPWNPLTRLAVARCAFDAHSVLLTARQAAQNIRLAGFGSVTTDYLLFVPFKNRFTEFCERTILRRVPIGAQYALCATRQ